MSEVQKSWSEALLSLFDLLVENADGIIDDTSVERVLEWLKSVCNNDQQLQKLLQCETVEKLKSDRAFANPTSSSFFLRLFGYLASKPEVFRLLNCGKDDDFLARFFEKPKTSSNLWNEGIVRNGYFQALSSLTEHEEGLSWLRNSGHIKSTLECVSDRSMFVAASARSLIAKYLVRETSLKMCGQPFPDISQNIILSNDKLMSVVERLKKMIHSGSEESISSPRISVVEVARALLCESSAIGQRILQETGLFAECLKLMAVGDKAVCEKLVDVVCEMAKNTRTWSLEWDKLCVDQHSVETNASTNLLGLCLELFRKGLISTGLELTAGLGPCQESSSVFPAQWLEVLFDVIEASLDLILTQTCHKTEGDKNGHHMNGFQEVDILELLDCLMSSEQHKKVLAKQQLGFILSPWIERRQIHSHVICQALAAAQQLTQQVSCQGSSRVIHWIRLCQDLIQRCSSQTKQSNVKLYGNQKVLKASLEYISSLAEIQVTSDLFECVDSSSVSQLFDGIDRTLLQLVESSESSATVISIVLKTLVKLLKITHQDLATELFRSETTKEATCKRARLEQDSSSVEENNFCGVNKPSNPEKLAFVLCRRLRDSRWEVRDSALEFIDSILQLKNELIDEFLCDHNIPAVVWDATDDSESYVRASALHVIGSLACQSSLWTALLQIRHLSEADVLDKLSSLLLSEEEAFPRRRAMECIVLWVDIRHPIATRILHSVSSDCGVTEVRRQNATETGPELEETATTESSISCRLEAERFTTEAERSTKEAERSTKEAAGEQSRSESLRENEVAPRTNNVPNQQVEGQSDGKLQPSEVGIVRSICRACQDFDWEVKLRGLQFWEAVIGFFTGVKCTSDSPSTYKTESPNGDLPMHFTTVSDQLSTSSPSTVKRKPEGAEKCLQVLYNMGALHVLINALNDCDHVVCDKALVVLARLQGIAEPDESPIERRLKTCTQLEDALGEDFSLDKFKEVVRVTDFQALIESSSAADTSLRSDPVSLIEDIIIAAKQADGNLLDCY